MLAPIFEQQFPGGLQTVVCSLEATLAATQRGKWRQKSTGNPSLLPHHLNWIHSMEEAPGAVYNPNSDKMEDINMLQHLTESRRDTGYGAKKDKRNYRAELP